jgi:signal transduction histidine kinase
VELQSLVRRLVQTRAKAFADHEMIVETLECTVLGDARRLERVVMNLLSNAVKYSPSDTRITVRVEKQESFGVVSYRMRGRVLPRRTCR